MWSNLDQGTVERSDVVAIGKADRPSSASSRRSRVSGTKNTTISVATAPTPDKARNSPL